MEPLYSFRTQNKYSSNNKKMLVGYFIAAALYFSYLIIVSGASLPVVGMSVFIIFAINLITMKLMITKFEGFNEKVGFDIFPQHIHFILPHEKMNVPYQGKLEMTYLPYAMFWTGVLNFKVNGKTIHSFVFCKDQGVLENGFKKKNIPFSTDHLPAIMFGITVALFAIMCMMKDQTMIGRFQILTFAALIATLTARKDKHLHQGLTPKGGVAASMLPLAGFFLTTAVDNHVFKQSPPFQANQMATHGKLDEAIPYLEAELQKKPTDTKIKNQLAWYYTTHPETSKRNYQRAIQLSMEAMNGAKNPRLSKMSADTLACAYLGNRQQGEAINIANSFELNKRLPELQSGNLCVDEKLNKAAYRAISSEGAEPSIQRIPASSD